MKNKGKELLKYYLLILLPAKAILVQSVSFGSMFNLPNLSQAFNLFFIVLNIILVFLNFNELLYNRYFFPLLILILSFLFIGFLRPISSIYFTGSHNDFAWYFKILSWISILPLSFLAFNFKEDIFLLRKWANVAFLIIFIGLLLSNTLKFGNTAYGLNIFYMGFWLTEAPLSITLFGFTPFFLLPKEFPKDNYILNKTGVIFLVVNFFLLCLVMKRSSILAFCLSVIVTIYLFFKCNKIKFNFKHLFIAFTFIFILIFGIYSIIAVTSPDALKSRTKDFTRAEKSGDIKQLGSGRLGVAEIYLNNFLDQPISQKIIGIDILGVIDKEKNGYLYTDIDIPPHNDYIDVLMNAGLLGLVFYWSFLLFSFLMVYRIYKANNDIICLYTSAITLGMFAGYFVVSIGGSFQGNIMLTGFMMLLGANLGISKEG